MATVADTVLESTIILPISWHDLGPLYRLEQAIFPQDAYSYLDLAIVLVMPGMVNRKIVTSGGTLMGFILVADSWLPWSAAWIITIGVAELYQNQGLGRHLLRTIEPLVRASRLRLTVREGNTPARHLYDVMGYTICRVHPAYYRDGENGVVMEKPLR